MMVLHFSGGSAEQHHSAAWGGLQSAAGFKACVLRARDNGILLDADPWCSLPADRLAVASIIIY
jgi:hypothetical protein